MHAELDTYLFFSMTVCDEEHTLQQAADCLILQNGTVVHQFWINGRHDQFCYFWSHTMLDFQHFTVHLVLQHPLKKRDIEVEVTCKSKHSRRRPQLLVVSCAWITK
jgi:hypothetical protein